jgi:iron complex transport system substrate-binding protein
MRLCLVLLASLSALSGQVAPDLEAANIRLGGLAYPRAAMDFQGGTVKLAAPPRRIVTLSDHVDEYLYQFLPGERIVGVSKSGFDESFSSVVDKVNQFHPEIIKDTASILRLKPDLVLAADSMSLSGSDLRAAGIPVFSISVTPTTLDQVAANIVALGYVTGADEAAKAELNRFQGVIEQVRETCKAPHGEPRIYGVSMTGFSFGDHTLFQDVIRLVRGTNVAAENGMHTYEKVSPATVAQWNPDWVFTWAVPGSGDYERRRWMEEDPGLRMTSAVKNNRVTVLQSKEVLPLSSLITGYIQKIADATCPGV